MRRALITIAVIISLAAAFVAGWVGAVFYGGHEAKERRYKDDVEAVMPVLAAEPAFRRLEPFDFPVNGFCLQGSVATQADYDRLWTEVARRLGEIRVGHVMADVWIDGMSERPKPIPKQAGDR
jgi:hypothetical protein